MAVQQRQDVMSIPEYQQHQSQAGLPPEWTTRLGGATSPDQIVQLAKRFVAMQDEIERSRLPSHCLPPSLQTPQDVCNYAFRLTQEQLRFDGPLGAGLLLDRMALFFSLASSRIAQLAHIARIRV
jgi:hypothetical protein